MHFLTLKFAAASAAPSADPPVVFWLFFWTVFSRFVVVFCLVLVGLGLFLLSFGSVFGWYLVCFLCWLRARAQPEPRALGPGA